jgi:hypothetical protein
MSVGLRNGIANPMKLASMRPRMIRTIERIPRDAATPKISPSKKSNIRIMIPVKSTSNAYSHCFIDGHYPKV